MRIFERKPGEWHLDYRESGRRYRPYVGSKREAQKALAKLKAEHILRRRTVRGASNDTPIETLKAAWFRHVEATCRVSTAKAYSSSVGVLLAGLPPVKRVRDLRPALVENWRAARLNAGQCENSLNVTTGVLFGMFRWGVDVELIESNPLAKLKRLKVRKRRFRRALSEDEARALIEHSPERLRRLWRFFLGTGFRRNEAVGLHWQDVDLDSREVFISAERSKNGDAATVPLSSALVEMLREMRAESGQTSGLVFLNSRGDAWTPNTLLRSFRLCLVAAGISETDESGKVCAAAGLDIHSLRVSFITHLIRVGVNPKTVQRLARHRTIQMTLNIYARTFPEDDRAAVERLPYESGQQADTEKGEKRRKAHGA